MDSVGISTIVALLFRHALTVACGALIASGYVPDTITKEQMIGAGMGIGAIALSWWNKRGYTLTMTRLKDIEDRVGIRGLGNQAMGNTPPAGPKTTSM